MGVTGVTNSGSSNRKGNSGHQEDPDCGNEPVKHSGDKQYTQSDDSMETDETKNQGSAGGSPLVNHSHMDDRKDVVGSDLDWTLKCSDQRNVTSTPPLSDQETI